MILDVKYFGKITEISKRESEQIELGDTINVKEFRIMLVSRYPDLKSETFQVAVNQDLKADGFQIIERCEIAILPPFAGG